MRRIVLAGLSASLSEAAHSSLLPAARCAMDSSPAFAAAELESTVALRVLSFFLFLADAASCVRLVRIVVQGARISCRSGLGLRPRFRP